MCTAGDDGENARTRRIPALEPKYTPLLLFAKNGVDLCLTMQVFAILFVAALSKRVNSVCYTSQTLSSLMLGCRHHHEDPIMMPTTYFLDINSPSEEKQQQQKIKRPPLIAACVNLV